MKKSVIYTNLLLAGIVGATLIPTSASAITATGRDRLLFDDYSYEDKESTDTGYPEGSDDWTDEELETYVQAEEEKYAREEAEEKAKAEAERQAQQAKTQATKSVGTVSDWHDITLRIHYIYKDNIYKVPQEIAVVDDKFDSCAYLSGRNKLNLFWTPVAYRDIAPKMIIDSRVQFPADTKNFPAVVDLNIECGLRSDTHSEYSWWVQHEDGSWGFAVDNGVELQTGIVLVNTGVTLEDGRYIRDNYLIKNGKMVTGWNQTPDGRWEYYYSDGKKAMNDTIDGYTIYGGYVR